MKTSDKDLVNIQFGCSITYILKIIQNSILACGGGASSFDKAKRTSTCKLRGTKMFIHVYYLLHDFYSLKRPDKNESSEKHKNQTHETVLALFASQQHLSLHRNFESSLLVTLIAKPP